MKTIDQVIQETRSCPHNGKLYLIDKITSISGLFCSDGDILYLVMNHEGCSPLSIATEYLQMDTNVFVQSFDEHKSFPDCEYNILRYKGSRIIDHTDNVASFVNLCVAHSRLLNGNSFEQFFYSLISLFQLPREQNFLNLVGLFGELTVIKHIHLTFGSDISLFWHSDGSFSKYDFSLSNKKAIEVKSSAKGDKSISIKHSQLFSSIDLVCLASVCVIEDNSGITMAELIDDLRHSDGICNNLQFEISLQRELKRVSPEEVNVKRFTVQSIQYYNNTTINPFPIIPMNVDKLEYNLDLTESPKMSRDQMLAFLN